MLYKKADQGKADDSTTGRVSRHITEGVDNPRASSATYVSGTHGFTMPIRHGVDRIYKSRIRPGRVNKTPPGAMQKTGPVNDLTIPMT